MGSHKELFYLKALCDINKEFDSSYNRNRLLNTFLLTLMGTFGIDRGFIAIFDKIFSQTECHVCKALDKNAMRGMLESIKRQHKAIFSKKDPFMFFDKKYQQNKQRNSVLHKTRRLFYEYMISESIFTFVPFLVDHDFFGVIGLSERINKSPFLSIDKELFFTLINQFSIMFSNLTFYQINRTLRDEIEIKNEAIEKTVKKVYMLENAQNLLFKFVPKSLERIIENHPEGPDLNKKDIDITVLFLDIEGYSTISERLEYEEITQLIETYFSYFLDDIFQFNGDINMNLGDGLMLIFQDENQNKHAENAVRAALAVKKKTQIINEKMRGFIEPFSLNIGINSGVACVGANRLDGYFGSRWTYTAIGPNVNIAARISSFAKKGDILVSENTASRVKDKFSFESLGPQLFKNIKREISIYRVKSAKY